MTRTPQLPCAASRPTRAFTLVEMLVSMAVLILLMTFIAQMMSSTQTSVNLSGKHLDADSQARLVFDRMAQDFAHMPHRTDVDFLFAKEPDPSLVNGSSTLSGANDKMFFYSEAPAYFSSATSANNTSGIVKSPVGLIGYCINTGTSNPLLPEFSLLRLSKGLTWDAPSNAASSGTIPGGTEFFTTDAAPSWQNGSLTTSGTSYPVPYAGTTIAGNPLWLSAVGYAPDFTGSDLTSINSAGTYQTDFDVLATGVVRMEFCFQVKDLTYPNSPSTAYSNYPIAHFTRGIALNTGTFQAGPPPLTPSNLNSMVIGDRWYDTIAHRAYICTGFVYNNSAIGTSVREAALWSPNGLADVNAIIVTIAIMDNNSRQLISKISNPANGDLFQAVSSALPDPTENTNGPTDLTSYSLNPPPTPHLPAQLWENAVASGTNNFVATTHIPPSAASQIRIYQRYFYLNN